LLAPIDSLPWLKRERPLRIQDRSPIPSTVISMKTLLLLRVVPFLGLYFFDVPPSSAQGPLTPPGAPAPTMKTLDQIASSGIAINATNTPGNATSVFVISAPGSYYLTDNVTIFTGKNGILINSNEVTIDLNGYGVFGILAGLSGITDGGTPLRGVTIRNGTVEAWTIAGVDLSHSLDSVVSGLIVNFCTGIGLTLGDASVVRDCMVRDSTSDNIKTGFNANITHCTAVSSSAGSGFNLGPSSGISGCVATFNKTGILAAPGCNISQCIANQNNGPGIQTADDSNVVNCNACLNGNASTPAAIQVGTGCTVSQCTASGNTAQFGISANFNSTVIQCTASNNTASQSISAGISGPAGLVKDCTTIANTNTNATATNNTGMGIYCNGNNSLIESCTSAGNKGDGIWVNTGSTVRDNVSGNNSGGAGVHALGGANRIEGNQVTFNDVGILVDGFVNLVLRNTARGNATNNYVIGINNRVAAIVTPTLNAAPIVGNTGGFAFGTDASANIAY
jgi:hypothetical protein